MGFHNTGVATVLNRTSRDINGLSQESRRTLSLRAGEAGSWSGELVPWAANALEIKIKALLFFEGAVVGGTPFAYIFQRIPGDVVFWAPYAGGNPSFENAQHAGSGPASLCTLDFSSTTYDPFEIFIRAVRAI